MLKHSSISYIHAALKLQEIENQELREALTNAMMAELSPLIIGRYPKNTQVGSSGIYDLTLKSGSSIHMTNPYVANK